MLGVHEFDQFIKNDRLRSQDSNYVFSNVMMLRLDDWIVLWPSYPSFSSISMLEHEDEDDELDDEDKVSAYDVG